MRRVYIGTSGYDYPEWKGSFYPEDLKRSEYLEYYSQFFNSLELNSTFYTPPTKEHLLSFYNRSYGRLKFSIKAHQSFTHNINSYWKDSATAFRASLEPLVEREALVSVLFQFPPSFSYIPDNRFYLDALLRSFKGIPLAVEFRSVDWIKESVIEEFSKRNVSLVFCKFPTLKRIGFKITSPFISDLAYIRLHEKKEDSWYEIKDGVKVMVHRPLAYTERELSLVLPLINCSLDEDRDVCIYFNNCSTSYGAINAIMLQELLYLGKIKKRPELK